VQQVLMPPRLTVELVPRTAWWTNVRSNVTRAEWEKCKTYAKAQSHFPGRPDLPTCLICGSNGTTQGRRHRVEADEIWDYDDDHQLQTLVGIRPLCPMCHSVKHLGRTRQVSSPEQWARVIEHIEWVNGREWTETYLEDYLEIVFAIWEARSQMEWRLDISFLTRIGISANGRPTK
jgi:hypothetical protein